MIRPEVSCGEGRSAPEERLGRCEVLLDRRHDSEVVQRGNQLRMVRSKHGLSQPELTQRGCSSLRVVSGAEEAGDFVLESVGFLDFGASFFGQRKNPVESFQESFEIGFLPGGNRGRLDLCAPIGRRIEGIACRQQGEVVSPRATQPLYFVFPVRQRHTRILKIDLRHVPIATPSQRVTAMERIFGPAPPYRQGRKPSTPLEITGEANLLVTAPCACRRGYRPIEAQLARERWQAGRGHDRRINKEGAMSRWSVCFLLALLASAMSRPSFASDTLVPCESEPTDMEISVGSIVQCSVSPVADTDLFRFYGEAGHRMMLTLTDQTAGTGYGTACVYDPGFTLIACFGTNDTGVRHILELEATGTYTVLVRESGDNQTATYNLALQSINPAPPEATSLCYDCSVPDTIDVVSDSDVMLFEGIAGETISLTVTDQTAGTGYPVAEVWAPDRSLVSTVSLNDTGQQVRLELTQTGTYTILLREVGDNQTSVHIVALQKLFPQLPEVPYLQYGEVLEGLTVSPVTDSDVFILPVLASSWIELTLTDMTAGTGYVIADIFDQARVLVATIGSNDAARSWSIANAPSSTQYVVVLHEAGDNQTASCNLGLQCLNNCTSDVENSAHAVGWLCSAPFPNPASSKIEYRIHLPVGDHVRASIFDVSGRLLETIVDDYLQAGSHGFAWDADRSRLGAVPSGMYFIRVSSRGRAETHPFVIRR